uniref:Uncharacterized protein n=1 Tax=Tanacetum cinerariifolium TaxID=118510 RepID=A0A6L2LRJ8_TANCI|nr:hypothetical protein [Tanacetum cinerariifolium]
MLFSIDDFSDDNYEGFEDDVEVWEVNKEWLMALVTPPSMPVVPPPITYEVGGLSTAAEGHSFTLLTPRFPVPSSVIKDLSTNMGNLEYGHGQLVIQAVGRLKQIGTQVEKGQQTVTQMDEAIARLSQQNMIIPSYEFCVIGDVDALES